MEGLFMSILLAEIAESQRLGYETLLETRLKHAPPESHAQIRREHAEYMEKIRVEQETERRHKELCRAIRDSGRSYRRSWWS